MSLLGQDGACLTHLSPSPPWREQQAPAGAGLGACRAPDCCRGPSMGQGWQAPGRPVSGTSMPQLSPQHRLKTAAAAAWGRGGMPPHSTRRPNPPCPAGRPAVRRASESLPTRAGLGLPCYGPPWPSNTGQSYLPLLRPRGASGKLRQVQDSELAGLGLQRAQPRDRSTGASWHPFADSSEQVVSSWPLGERVQPPTLRAGRPPKGGHVSPTSSTSTRSGYYPPTVY